MATNKHALIRYSTLNRCFSNFGKRYYIEDLLKECNNALFEYAGILDGIKRRQIFDDIRFMESETGYAIPLLKIREGKRVYYRYSDKNFSIQNQKISDFEINQINNTLMILSRFKGLPNFDWVDELQVRLNLLSTHNNQSNLVVDFEQNPYLKGIEYFAPVFEFIVSKKVIEVRYRSFKSNTATKIIIHPYFLKQYNQRWFLFGFNKVYQSISNLALDRIVAVKEVSIPYIENENFDFEEYFEDIIGVTIIKDRPVEKLTLQINRDLWPYIETKPLHGSQKIKSRENNYVEIELQVQVNHELISTILSFGNAVKIVKPKDLQDIIIEKAKEILNNYSTCADQMHR